MYFEVEFFAIVPEIEHFDGESVAKLFIQSSYEAKDSITVDLDDSVDGEVYVSHSVYIRHKITDLDVRRTVLEFGRCFVFAPIPGFVLRKESSCNAATNAIWLFTSFFECSHNEYLRVCRN